MDSLSPGVRIGAYEILAVLGRGGMGEVYRALDVTLKREVAIKVLPARTAADAERIERFRREARVLAALSHPHIGAIYGVESTGEAASPGGPQPLVLVLELVQGEDLSERLERGPLPLADALAFAHQIADALEEAHENGIVHRDLKPANIKITPADKVKVLDFGLARVLDTAASLSSDSSKLDTLTSPAVTAHGVIMGTAAYMSPEQARGKAVDRRADIWAFGAVFYEMLTGHRLFQGETVTDVLASIVSADVDLGELPAGVPDSIRRLLARCLDRNARTRLRDIGEARIAIERATRELEEGPPELGPALVTESRRRTFLPWVIAVAAIVLALVSVLRALRPPANTAAAQRVVSAIPAPPAVSFSASRGPMALSRDGTKLAFVVIDSIGRNVLAVQSLDNGDARVLNNTEDASHPFWSPDGRSLGFFADRKLARIDLDGDRPRILADAPLPEGGTWNKDGIIVFAPGDWGKAIAKVHEDGGQVTPIADAFSGSISDYMLRPDFLPDGRRFLFSVHDQGAEGSGVWVGFVDGSPPRHLLQSSATAAVYVDPGYVLYWQDGAVRARTFDPRTLELGAEDLVIAEGVAKSWPQSGLFSASDTGLVVYLPGPSDAGSSQLVWVDRAGRDIQVVSRPGEFYFPRISHDGRRVVVDESTPLADLWIDDLTRTASSRFTFDSVDETLPVWSPNDSVIYYARVPAQSDVWRRRLAGNAVPELVVKDGNPTDISLDGRTLMFRRDLPEGRFSLWLYDLQQHVERPWIDTPFSNRTGRFAPDGRWAAYTSNESGRLEVYLQHVPDLGEKIAVSTAGGVMPVWRADGSELYYWAVDGELTAVPVTLTDPPVVGQPTPLFKARLRTLGGYNPQFDVSADGQRFLLNRLVERRSEAPMTLIQNWSTRPQ